MSKTAAVAATRLASKELSKQELEGKTWTQSDLNDWEAYESVRAGGRYNMFDTNARLLTCLSNERYMFIMKHYSELRDAFMAAKQERNPRKNSKSSLVVRKR